MVIDFKNITKLDVYRVLTHTVTPRPIAWVLTENENGTFNVAPFSYFNIVSADPGVLMFSVGHKRNGDKKDTWVNIERSQHCTVHIAHSALVQSLNETARPLAAGESELDRTDLSLSMENGFVLPRITQAPVAFSTQLMDVHLVGHGPQGVVYVEVTAAFIADELIDASSLKVDTQALDPLARLGGDDYSLLGAIKTLARPT